MRVATSVMCQNCTICVNVWMGQVTSLVGRLWQCRGLQQPLHSSIYSVIETWMEGIRKVQARRKEEMVGMANRNHSSASRVQDHKGKCESRKLVSVYSGWINYTVSGKKGAT